MMTMICLTVIVVGGILFIEALHRARRNTNQTVIPFPSKEHRMMYGKKHHTVKVASENNVIFLSDFKAAKGK